MIAPRHTFDDHARDALDAIGTPIAVTSAVRDRDGRLLDFRLEHVNLAAARWAGLHRDAMSGRLVTDLVPAVRPTGVFDALEHVVATGEPMRARRWIAGTIEEGRTFAATFELAARRLGDGYVSAWREAIDGSAAEDLAAVLERVIAALRTRSGQTKARPGRA